MKIVLREWLKDKTACWMLFILSIINILQIIINNRIIIFISNVFENHNDYQKHIVIIIAALIFDTILSIADGYLHTTTRAHIFTYLMDRYNDKILDADYNLFTKYSVANISLAQEFINKIAGLGIRTMRLCIQFISVGVTLYTIYTISKSLLIPIVIIYIIGFLVFKRIYKLYIGFDKEWSTIKRVRNQEVENIINGFTEVRSYNLANFHKESLHIKNKACYDLVAGKGKVNSKLYGAISTVEYAGLITVVIYSVKQIAAGIITQAQAMSLVMFIFKIIDPILTILDYIDELSDNLSLSKDYDQIVSYENQMKDGTISINSFDESIELNNVSFSYDDTKNAINNISMKIEKGQRIGICGVSGGGKTTLFKLINKFYEPTKGNITIDGIDIKDITFKSYRKFIGSVHQENSIFPGSIRENVIYGTPNATEHEMIEACKKAHIYDFVVGLDQKFETEVGPRGLKLSGGQKQRIALARLFLRNPEIILLDEATSALDNESENVIQEAIDSLEGKTIITIAHRLSTIKNCDIIYVLGKNGIIESGTHDELVSLKGAYFKMLK